jgi:[ribosomal protein S18]-alanine N-acetyltransferase
MEDDSLTIRPLAADDLTALAAIQGDFGWPPETYLNYDCRVAIFKKQIAGFLVSRETAPQEREILNLAVDRNLRRRGIARELLKDELSRGAGRWFLEVRESNAPAINLYRSMGFQAAGRRPDYYSVPPEAAIVMTFFS